MADLIIRGLHLPKSLGGEETHIDVRIFSDGTVIMATSRPPYYQKFEAVPLPEGHGRLIDGTDLYAVLDGGFDVDLDELPETKDALLCMIQSAETIVPAEQNAENACCSEGGGEDD